MKRVAVVGNPGSGKSTFTKNLAAKTGLPAVHLDFYHLQNDYSKPENLELWIARAKELIEPDMWIIEGNYASTIHERFDRASSIIFFDFATHKSIYGVIKRRIQYHGKHREEMPDDWKEHIDPGFLKFVWKFRQNNRVKILEAIKKSGKPVTVFKSHRQANKYLSRIR
jgi:adenylate kinase family enzyme